MVYAINAQPEVSKQILHFVIKIEVFASMGFVKDLFVYDMIMKDACVKRKKTNAKCVANMRENVYHHT